MVGSGLEQAITELRANAVNILFLDDIFFQGNDLKEFFSALSSNESLTQLYITRSGLTGEDAAQIVDAVNGHKNLKSLHLNDNPINLEGFALLSEALAKNNMLEEINLTSNSIADEHSLDD